MSIQEVSAIEWDSSPTREHPSPHRTSSVDVVSCRTSSVEVLLSLPPSVVAAAATTAAVDPLTLRAQEMTAAVTTVGNDSENKETQAPVHMELGKKAVGDRPMKKSELTVGDTGGRESCGNR